MGEIAIIDGTNPEPQSSFSAELGLEATDLGDRNSFRFKLLTMVLNEHYEDGLAACRAFMEAPSPFPNFHDRTRRYVNHAMDLVYAIRAKRNFPGLSSLTRAKQQELKEKYKNHFRELSHVLRTIERIERDLELVDAKSTIMVIRALWYAVILLLIVAFVIELFSGVAITGWTVASDGVDQMVDFVFSKF